MVMKKRAMPIRFFLSILLIVALAAPPFGSLAEGSGISWKNTDVEGAVKLLTTARLQDDFHLAVNRSWLAFEPIYSGASEASSFMDQSYTVVDRKIELLENKSLTGHDAELVRRLYSLTLDWKTRNALGFEPLRPYVEEIEAIGSLAEMTQYLTSEANAFFIDPSLYSVTVDPSHPSRYIACIAPLPLILGDSAEYEQRTDYGELVENLSRQATLYLLGRLGYSQQEAQAVFDGALAYDALFVPYIAPVEAQYEADYLDAILNYYVRAELDALCGAFPMGAILDVSGLGASEVFWVTEPEYFAALAKLYNEENLPLLKDWLIYYMVNMTGYLMDREAYVTLSSIVYQAYGVSGEPDDLDIALDTIEGFLSIPMDNLYIQAYCTPEMREDVLTIIQDVISAYREMLANEDWLSPQTREKAIEKLDRMRVRAVYPDTLGDWSALDFKGSEEGGTMLDAYLAIQAFDISLWAGQINQPVDKDAWDQASHPAAEVNAAYDVTNNSINIYAGLLGGLFYDQDMSIEEMLGGLGVIIGHEISHAFDPTGSSFDGNGVVSSWWLPEDYDAYLAKADKVAAYYDTFVPYKGGTYSGKRVQDEAIADMSGMKCVLTIVSHIPDFDYDAFFRQYAKVWRTKMRQSAMMVTVATDAHPLGCLRTNVTVQQFEAFYETYQVKPGDGMYLAPEDRIAVW